jgi:hypothetical protein
MIIPNETQPTGAVCAKTVEVANGGELVIFFEKLCCGRQGAVESGMPLLAVLRDTIGAADPTNDGLLPTAMPGHTFLSALCRQLDMSHAY